jgi:hypothetical protein
MDIDRPNRVKHRPIKEKKKCIAVKKKEAVGTKAPEVTIG